LSVDPHIVRCTWTSTPYGSRSPIFDGRGTLEGLFVERLRFTRDAELPPVGAGEIVSVVRGGCAIETSLGDLVLDPATHVFLPAAERQALRVRAGTELLRMSASPEAGSSARGHRVLVRNERFLAAAATTTLMLRWIFTSQYVSRRIFLHHDLALVGRNGDPVSWFHTTMFDTRGLPANAEGEPVFKMSYNSRTEFNVLYDVAGDVRVRFAEHPYSDQAQRWGPWHALDSETTYRLLEPATIGPLRNKHEVFADGGHASLFCVFDPAPTGVERHQPGDYSDYEAFSVVSQRGEYARHREVIGEFDRMVDALSLAVARGESTAGRADLQAATRTYELGLAAQRTLEASVLEACGPSRRAALEPWRTPAVGRIP
jgi:hypothetical protein